MKLYGYRNKNGNIEQVETEVEEKVVLVPEEGKVFPLVYEKQIDKESVGDIIETGYCQAVFYKVPDFDFAKEQFLEHRRRELSEKEIDFEEQSKRIEELKSEIKNLEQATENTDSDL